MKLVSLQAILILRPTALGHMKTIWAEPELLDVLVLATVVNPKNGSKHTTNEGQRQGFWHKGAHCCVNTRLAENLAALLRANNQIQRQCRFCEPNLGKFQLDAVLAGYLLCICQTF